MLNLSLFLFIPLFIVASFLAFYVPGRVVLGKQDKLSKTGNFAVSYILGIALWGWQAYIFGFLHLRNLSLVYLLLFFLYFIKNKYYVFKLPKIEFKKLDPLIIIIAVVGIFGQTVQFIRNGQMTSAGLFITNNNNMDQVWHVSLTQEFVRHFPPSEPGMYGIPLLNYHFWFNMVAGDLIRVFNLPIWQTVFDGLYVLGPVLLAIVGYSFAKSILNSKKIIRIFMFFLFFSGDVLTWFMFILNHKLNLLATADLVFENSVNFMDSPGRGFAVLIVFSALILLCTFKEKISLKNVLLIGILMGSMMGFKIYIAIPFMLGLFVYSLLKLFRKDFTVLVIFIISSLLFLTQFLPFTTSGSGLIFLPFEMPRQFMVQSAFNTSWIDQRLLIYKQHFNYFRIIEYGVIMSLIFVVVQFGLKILGFFPFKKVIKLLGKDFYLFLYTTLLSSLILGLFFYQKVGGANIWEFFLSTSVVLGIFTSLIISEYIFVKNKILTAIFIVIFLLLTLPRWVTSTYGHINADYLKGFHGVSNNELEVYDYLKNNTPKDSVVLMVDQLSYVSYSSVANVISERSMFLTGQGVSQIDLPQIIKRKEDVKSLAKINSQDAVDLLKRDKINYVFVADPKSFPTASKSDNLSLVFSNVLGKIYKVN